MFRKLAFSGAVAVLALLLPAAYAQVPGGGGIPNHSPLGSTLRPIEKTIWHVFGKVTNVHGEPIRDATVHVDIGYGGVYIRDLTTDVQGLFRTDYTLDAETYKRLAVSVTVDREGYRTAREFVDFGDGGKTWEINVTMREANEGADDLQADALVNTLAPQLRALLASDPSVSSDRKDLERGLRDFLDDHDAVKAIPSLDKVAKKLPECGNCQTLLGLAMLSAGSWTSANNGLAAGAKLAARQSNKTQQALNLIILGALENWRGAYDKAAGWFMQAKDLEPNNGFLLQELGRTLVFQKNWEAADLYLAKAIANGASPEAKLLRTRALMEEGDPEAAQAQLKDYLGKKEIREFPLPVRTLYAQVETRLNLETYAKVKSLVSEPLPNLVKAFPELKGLQPAAPGQNELAMILANTGKAVEAFFTNFPNTISVEQIHEERLGKDGKVKDSLDQKFQYLLLARPERWGLGLEEFRTDSHGERAGPTGLNAGLMLTSGFASASLLFHPAYQRGADFRYLGHQTLNGRDCYVVAFAQKPEKAQMVERFNTDESTVLVLFQGVAWIDAQSYRIVRLRTDLLKPQQSIRLNRQTTEITYDPVRFKQVASAMWLPSDVAVTVEWKGKTFRNVHHYSDFKLFNTETKDKVQHVDAPQDATDDQPPKS
jgi:tetratricopeptide (TPR) repeat protein